MRIVPILLFAVALVVGTSMRAQDAIGELDLSLEEGGDGKGDLETWWNPAWAYRQTLTLREPDAAIAANGRIRIVELNPLLLMNTGCLRQDGADLRLVDGHGRVLRAGVQNPGKDTDSYIWCEIPTAELNGVEATQGQTHFMLYYGNPEAPAGDVQPLPEEPREVPVAFGPRESRAGAPPPRKPDDFFANFIVVDTQDWRDPEGRAPIFTRVVEPGFLSVRGAGDASGNTFLMLRDLDRHRGPEPLTATARVQIPAAGRWYVHIRRMMVPKRGDIPAPFTLELGGESFTPELLKNKLSPLPTWYWSSLSVDLEAGEQILRLLMPASPGIDCIVLTRDATYLPDLKDVCGPVWYRFRLPEDSPYQAAFFQLFSVIEPWTSHGPQGEVAGWVFRHQTVRAYTDYLALCRDPQEGIPRGEWSPWVRSLESEAPMWWNQVTAQQAGVYSPRTDGDPVPAIEFQIATRPDEARVFRSGVESTGQGNACFFTMPSANDLATTLRATRSYGQASELRFTRSMALVREPVDGPDRIFVSTMGSLRSPDEIVHTLKTLQALGFNGAEMRTTMSRGDYWLLTDDYGLDGSTAHHWYPKVDYTTWPLKAPADKTAREMIEDYIRAAATEQYGPPSRYGIEMYERLRLIIMGDEIGPATNEYMINNMPLIREWFHDYLREQGMTPEDFGKTTWGEIYAYEAAPLRVGSEAYNLINAIRVARGEEPLDDGLPDPPPLDELPTWQSVDEGLDLEEATMDAEAVAQLARSKQEAQPVTTAEGKRLVYWQERFKSLYTNRLYGIGTELIEHYIETGDLVKKPLCSPNFQAAPIMTTQMWNGTPNLFEWGASRASNFIMIEDWIVDPHRVGFGTRVMQAAAREHDLPYGMLLVGGRMKTRALLHLATGGRTLKSYLYGPERVIGPPWADHEPSILAWAELNGALGRFEDDLLAVRPRPTRAAMLVAVTSDINSRYGGYVYHGRHQRERGDLYSLLLGAHVATEVISEEEILAHPEALSRYDLLYVVDPHVRVDVQQQVKTWVEQGGTLWATYAALSRDAFDEPSTLFDGVFGLAQRPTPQPTPVAFDEVTEGRTVQVPANGPLTAVRFTTSPVRPGWTPGPDATVLASFADGGAALLEHPYGKGRAYIYGSTVAELTSGYNRVTPEPEDAPAKRRLVTIAAETAAIPLQAATSHPRVLAQISDGDGVSMIVVVNVYVGDVSDITVRAALPWKPTELLRDDGESVPFTYADGELRFSVSLVAEDGHMYRLKP